MSCALSNPSGSSLRHRQRRPDPRGRQGGRAGRATGAGGGDQPASLGSRDRGGGAAPPTAGSDDPGREVQGRSVLEPSRSRPLGRGGTESFGTGECDLAHGELVTLLGAASKSTRTAVDGCPAGGRRDVELAGLFASQAGAAAALSGLTSRRGVEYRKGPTVRREMPPARQEVGNGGAPRQLLVGLSRPSFPWRSPRSSWS
jgi:hypothetical protein